MNNHAPVKIPPDVMQASLVVQDVQLCKIAVPASMPGTCICGYSI